MKITRTIEDPPVKKGYLATAHGWGGDIEFDALLPLVSFHNGSEWSDVVPLSHECNGYFYVEYTKIQQPHLGVSHLPKGWAVTYKGVGWDNDKEPCYYAVYDKDVETRASVEPRDLRILTPPAGVDTNHYWELIPPVPVAPTRTTIQDLIGEDGQTSCYIYTEDGSVTPLSAIDLMPLTIQAYIDMGYRWHSNPFLTYSEAHQFVI